MTATWTAGDPRDLGHNMRLVVCDEAGRILGAYVVGEYDDDDGPMRLYSDAWHAMEWQSSWLWMRVPTREEHFGAQAGR